MPGLPSPAALRNAAVACVAGAGVALLGVSVSNLAAIDGTLAAAQQAAPAQQIPVSYVRGRDCHRTRHHREAAPAQAPSSNEQY